jgi:hypothetical protein
MDTRVKPGHDAECVATPSLNELSASSGTRGRYFSKLIISAFFCTT